VLRSLWVERAGVLSTRVLQELYVNATRKIRKPLTKPQARSVVDTYAPWCVEGTTANDLVAAFRIEDHARIGFWDALIIAVAARAGARRVVSEDLNAGQSIAGVAIHNPFKVRSRARPRQ
jgi:predicted nucleic acid-binding protein